LVKHIVFLLYFLQLSVYSHYYMYIYKQKKIKKKLKKSGSAIS